MSIIWAPREIEARSMKIVEGFLHNYSFSPLERAVVKRVIHATADTSLIGSLLFHFKEEGKVSGWFSENTVYTDVNMLKAGINQNLLKKYGGKVSCSINEPAVSTLASQMGVTRAAAAMYAAGKDLDGAVVTVGNSPTALFAVLDMVERKIARPGLVVGIPVGFVGAAEAKELLAQRNDISYVTLRGKRGGSPVAAAVINALLAFQEEEVT